MRINVFGIAVVAALSMIPLIALADEGDTVADKECKLSATNTCPGDAVCPEAPKPTTIYTCIENGVDVNGVKKCSCL